LFTLTPTYIFYFKRLIFSPRKPYQLLWETIKEDCFTPEYTEWYCYEFGVHVLSRYRVKQTSCLPRGTTKIYYIMYVVSSNSSAMKYIHVLT